MPAPPAEPRASETGSRGLVRYVTLGLVSLVCAIYVALGLEMRTSITEFLPRDGRSKLLDLARELSNAPQSRVLVLTLSADSAEQRGAAVAALRARLDQSGLFEWVRSSVAGADQEQAYKLLFPPRLGLAAPPGTSGPVADGWLQERIAALKARLGSPLGMLERRLAPEDPLGLFVSHLERQSGARGKLRAEDGQLVTEDGRFAVLFAATRAPAFDAVQQTRVAKTITQEIERLSVNSPSLTCDWIGINRFALETERSVRADIERISSLSLLGIFLLYWLVFRSLREPFLVLLPISFGCLLAVAACQLCFGFVHGLTLAFGSSIIGVAEDYSTHFFSHRIAIGSSEDNESMMRRLWPGMWMGGLTTMAGIAALGVSGFPGLMQMAVFGVVGVFGALLSTRYLLPGLSRKRGRTQSGRLGVLGERLIRALSIRPVTALWFVVPALLLSVIGLPRVNWQDGALGLRTPLPALDAENQRIQARLGRGAGGRMMVALGSSDQAALERTERGVALLERARAQGLVRSFREPTSLVPSLAHQRAVRARFSEDASLPGRLSSVLEREGFVPAAFAGFFTELARKDPVLLEPAQILHSPLADLLVPFRAELPSGVAYLSQLDTEHSVELTQLFAGEKDLFYVDQDALFNQANRAFRSRMLWLVLVGLGLVLLTLFARYRDLGLCLVGMVPALLGAGAALGMQGLWGTPANLMHLIAVLLVLSMGVDYGIYMLESRGSMQEGVVTLGSVLLAALTTVLSFGLLGISDNPALAGIGITVSLGLLFTVLVSPVVLVWTQRRVS